jgi:hypothetical protein
MNNEFIYSILQYRHSLALGESLNIGVLFSFPEENKVVFIPGNTQRVKCVYPTFDATIFTKISKNIKSKIKDTSPNKNNFFNGEAYSSFKDYIQREILPEDSTSLQFSDPYNALNDLGDTSKTVDEFCKILLPSVDEKNEEIRHNEAYIIKDYTERLTRKTNQVKLENRLRKNIQVKANKVSINFEVAWKNETFLHLVKPISFDLKEEYLIQHKAVQYWGSFFRLKEYAQQEHYKFDLLISKPQFPNLENAYFEALELLNEKNESTTIITEEKLEAYSEETAANLNKEML